MGDCGEERGEWGIVGKKGESGEERGEQFTCRETEKTQYPH